MKADLSGTMEETDREAIAAGLDGIAEAIQEHVREKLNNHRFVDHY